MANGNLVATFTDLVLPGNGGMDLKFVRQFNAGVGWQFGLEGIPILGPVQDDPDECCDYPGFAGVGIDEKSFPSNGATGSAPEYLTKQFWRFTWATQTLEFPNGWVGTFNGGLLQELHDQFDNRVTFTYTGVLGRLQTVTQHLAGGQTRTVTYTYDSGRATSMTYDGKQWTYGWTGTNLTSIQPPAGPPWAFSYTTQTSQECFGTYPGSVAVTTPTAAGAVRVAVRHIAGLVAPPECHASSRHGPSADPD
jgi:hypothetical protein